MARNAIESDLRSSKMPQIEPPKWPPAAILKKNSKKKCCVLIWNGEKCIQKWFSVIQNGRRQPFCQFKRKIKVAYWSEMARNVIESDIFGHPKWPPAAILWKKNEVAYWSEMARNAIESDFQPSKMGWGFMLIRYGEVIQTYLSQYFEINLKWSWNIYGAVVHKGIT